MKNILLSLLKIAGSRQALHVYPYQKIALIGAEFTRPADTIQYAVNDVIGTSPASLIEFANCAGENGGSGWITRIKVQKNNSNITAAQMRLHLFHTAPDPVADNAQYPLLYANKDKRIGYIDLSLETEGTGGDSAWKAVFMTNIPFVCAAGSKSLYGVLEAKGAYTPASGEKFYVEIAVDRY